jgi:hypothetical protein
MPPTISMGCTKSRDQILCGFVQSRSGYQADERKGVEKDQCPLHIHASLVFQHYIKHTTTTSKYSRDYT